MLVNVSKTRYFEGSPSSSMEHYMPSLKAIDKCARVITFKAKQNNIETLYVTNARDVQLVAGATFEEIPYHIVTGACIECISAFALHSSI